MKVSKLIIMQIESRGAYGDELGNLAFRIQVGGLALVTLGDSPPRVRGLCVGCSC